MEMRGRSASAAPAERGAANEAVLGLLARVLVVPRNSISLVSGSARRDKIVQLAGISQAEIERCLASAERKDVR